MVETYENIESEDMGKGNAGKVLAPMFHKTWRYSPSLDIVQRTEDGL